MRSNNGKCVVEVRQVVGIPKGTFVRLQPHSINFNDVHNPKAVLEYTLRKFTVLTKGEWEEEKKYRENTEHNHDVLFSAVCFLCFRR